MGTDCAPLLGVLGKGKTHMVYVCSFLGAHISGPQDSFPQLMGRFGYPQKEEREAAAEVWTKADSQD